MPDYDRPPAVLVRGASTVPRPFWSRTTANQHNTIGESAMRLYGEYDGPADEKDLELAALRQLNRDCLADNLCEPLEGDVVQFNDGTRYRVSYAWRIHEDNDDPGLLRSVQTTKGDSFHWY